VQTQNEKLKQLNEKLKAKIAEHKSLAAGAETVEEKKAREHPERRFRSRRELSDLTVLDRIHSHMRVELEENLKNLRKLETQNEFNSIVARIREFLLTDADRSENSTPVLASPPRIRVYEYNLFKEQASSKLKN